jgi:hypothetical protein
MIKTGHNEDKEKIKETFNTPKMVRYGTRGENTQY